ncbi:MAG TPA: SH3 domain-containing protein [Pyrinomonadaceae bacterium]|jgi:hypothetical protein
MSQLLRFFVSLFCIVIFTFNTLAQSRWSFVGMTPDSALWYVDKSIKKKPSGIVQAWEKVVYPDKSYIIGLNEWKCSEKMKRVIQANSYYPNGDYQSRTLTPLPWRYVVPDAIEEKTYKIVCDDLSNRKSETENNKADSNFSFAQIVKKAKLMREASQNSEVIRELAVGEKLVLVSVTSTSTGWYLVIDQKSDSKAWVHGNYFKIIKANSSPRKTRIRKTK